MKERRKMSYREVSARVERVRRTYSRIGEPLPADVIIDLCRHLGTALELVQAGIEPARRKRADA